MAAESPWILRTGCSSTWCGRAHRPCDAFHQPSDACGAPPDPPDLAAFDFAAAKVDHAQINRLATLDFTQAAYNVVMIGGTGIGKTHLATALGVTAVMQHGERMPLYSIIELVNTLELEKAAGKQGRLAYALMRLDLVILDKLGYLPFSQASDALLFHLLSKL
jgi:DNA replication protein DnaC